MESRLSLQLHVMLRQTVGLTMKKQGFWCVQLSWIGLTGSKYHPFPPSFIDKPTAPRVKKKLRSAEIIVPGDQWPILLYQDYAYDPEDPWKGLLRSAILVSVSFSAVLSLLKSTAY
jgi:hypothetical protein